MGVFKKNIAKKNGKDTIFVGANVPLQANMYLTLYSLATGTSKSQLIANLTKQFQETFQEEISTADLVKLVAANGVKLLELESKKTNFSSIKFFNEMKKELLKKGVLSETADLIIINIKDETKHQ